MISSDFGVELPRLAVGSEFRTEIMTDYREVRGLRVPTGKRVYFRRRGAQGRKANRPGQLNCWRGPRLGEFDADRQRQYEQNRRRREIA